MTDRTIIDIHVLDDEGYNYVFVVEGRVTRDQLIPLEHWLSSQKFSGFEAMNDCALTWLQDHGFVEISHYREDIVVIPGLCNK